MLIRITPEEHDHIAKLWEEHEPQRKEVIRKTGQLKREGKTDTEEYKQLLIRQQAIHDSIQAAVDAYMDKCQRERFEPIRKGGKAAILEHGKGQLDELLERIYEAASAEYGNYKNDFLKGFGIGLRRGDSFYINSSYAFEWIKDELRLHIEALADDKKALQELIEEIVDAVARSPYTDNSEIVNIRDKQPNIKVHRRSPLRDISHYGIMGDKATAQLLADGDLFQQKADGQMTLRWAVNQAPAKQEAVPVYMAITYEGSEAKLTKKLTAFDKQVCEAVATRFYYWHRENEHKALYITPQEVWRTMNGKRTGDGQAKPSTAQVQRICDSLDKMRFTHFYMDISEEIRAFDLQIDDERIIGGHIDTYVLDSSKLEFVTDKGKTVPGYRISEEPILYTYNRAKNHLLYVPYEMLDTSGYVSDSKNVAEFKGYLLQQIQLMKNAAEEKKGRYFKRSNVILLETIYKGTGVLPPEERLEGRDFTSEASRQTVIRRMRKADKEKIEGILEAWKDKNWIKNYTALNAKKQPVGEKQQVAAYSIEF